MPPEAPIFPFDWHHPVCIVTTHFSGDPQWAPFGSWMVWKGTLLPEPPCLCCWDWFNRQRQLTEGESPTGYSPHTHTHTHIQPVTQPQTPPLLRRQTLTGLTIQPSPCPCCLSTSLTSAGSTLHSWITIIHHRRSTVWLQNSAKPHRAQQHGEQHVMCPPA